MRSKTSVTTAARLREAMEKVRAAELKRLYCRVPKLTLRSRDEIRRFSDVLIASMLEPPLRAVSEETSVETANDLLDAIQRLFQLDLVASKTDLCIPDPLAK